MAERTSIGAVLPRCGLPTADDQRVPLAPVGAGARGRRLLSFLDGLEKLLRIADLIRERPDVTSRELAEHLGYAEAKSVYYWLSKNGFTLRSFRAAVLRGEWPPGQNRLALREYAPYGTGDGIPLIVGFDEQGAPEVEGGFLDLRDSGVRYAFRWQQEHEIPYLEAGDILLLSDRAPQNGATVLVRHGDGRLGLCRFYQVDRGILLIEAWHPQRLLDEPLPPILGVVTGVVRVL
jgi:hypothetical protein